jgi:hypothetical protein
MNGGLHNRQWSVTAKAGTDTHYHCTYVITAIPWEGIVTRAAKLMLRSAVIICVNHTRPM